MPLSVINKTRWLSLGVWKRSFFVTLFFVSLASCLFWLDTFRGYEAEMRVLVIGKSPSASTEQVIENIAELAGNLSFYEQMLATDDLIEDDFVGYTQDKRKALWNEMVSVQRSDNSGVLIVRANQETRERAERLAQATVKTLFSVAGFYYNIKTDIDVRVVDETIVIPALRQPIHYVLISLGSAVIVTGVFFWLLSVTPYLFQKRGFSFQPSRSGVSRVADETKRAQQTYTLGASVPYIDPQKFVPTRPASLTFGLSHEEQQIRQEIVSASSSIETPVPPARQHERMLPGMDIESLPFELEEAPTEAQPVVPVAQKADPIPLVSDPIPTNEPTVEEYKRRLNELLAGGK